MLKKQIMIFLFVGVLFVTNVNLPNLLTIPFLSVYGDTGDGSDYGNNNDDEDIENNNDDENADDEENSKDDDDEIDPSDVEQDGDDEDEENDEEDDEIDPSDVEQDDDDEEDADDLALDEEIEDKEFTEEPTDIVIEPSQAELFLSNPINVSTFDELKDAIEDAETDVKTQIILTEDIEIEESLTIDGDKNIVITDDGQAVRTLSVAPSLTLPISNTAVFIVAENATLSFDPTSDNNFIFDAENLELSGSGQDSGIFVRSRGELNIYGGTFKNAYLKKQLSGAIFIQGENAVFNMYGGLITDSIVAVNQVAPVFITDGAVFNMYGGSISGNKMGSFLAGDSCGGVLLMYSAQFTMYDGNIDNNKGYVGGVYLYYQKHAVSTNAPVKFIMNGGTISNNTATCGGGVFVFCNAEFIMNNGTIRDNVADVGGGVGTFDLYPVIGTGFSIEEWYNKFYRAAFIMNGGTITNNHAVNNTAPNIINADGVGGGIYVASHGVEINKGEITNNISDDQGGGIYIGTDPYIMKLNNALITNNHANGSGDHGYHKAPNGSGGGIWLCPTGTLEIQDYGLAVIGNTATTGGDDITSEEKDSDEFYTVIPNNLFGGGSVIWHKDSPDDRHSNETMDLSNIERDTYYVSAEYTADAERSAEKLYTVLISGNESVRGGGIGSNGGILAVSTVEPEEPEDPKPEPEPEPTPDPKPDPDPDDDREDPEPPGPTKPPIIPEEPDPELPEEEIPEEEIPEEPEEEFPDPKIPDEETPDEPDHPDPEHPTPWEPDDGFDPEDPPEVIVIIDENGDEYTLVYLPNEDVYAVFNYMNELIGHMKAPDKNVLSNLIQWEASSGQKVNPKTSDKSIPLYAAYIAVGVLGSYCIYIASKYKKMKTSA